jgi:NodT family efflux transporter outer membrane factor (OMF) lipoprotein
MSRSPLPPPRLAALSLLLALGACAVGPEWTGAPPIAVPAHWSRDAETRPIDTTALGEWWKDFRDPLLDRLIEEAVAGNLDVASARAAVRAARAARREAVGGLWPSLDGSASAERVKSTGTGGSNGTVGSQVRAGFDASWEVDLFGANAATVAAAAHGEAAAEEDLRAALLTLTGDVASTYAELRGHQARAALARRTAASQRRTAELTRAKRDAGTAAALDLVKAEATAATTEAAIPSLETAAAEAIHRLSVLTGRDPAALNQRLRPAGRIPTTTRALPRGIPADVLRNRPDVRAAEARLAQATAKIAVAEAALYPSVSLTGSLSTTGARVGDLARASTVAWSWGPSVAVPIFAGGRLVAARDAAAADRDTDLVAWKAAVLSALEDVENALVARARERERGDRLAEAAAKWRRAADLSRTLWVAGTASFLDVLDAERSAYSAEDALIESRVALATDRIALAKALGGGWMRPVDASRPEIVDEGTGPRLRRF